MKKIVFLLLIALCLPIGLMAQSYDDDLYFIPSKEKEEPAPEKKEPVRRQATTNIYTSPGTTVVVQDRKGNTRDVDEYNRRYDARENDFEIEDDTLYIKEKSRPDLDGEWVNGEFNGSQDDYEYAERIIRFRNPRFAVSISSPFYWDIVYGSNSWDWNVYTDGLYAYAFPTFSNPMWWDWRYNSYGPGWGWGWSRPYYGWGGYYGGWYGGWYGGGYWGGHWGHHHHYPGYYPGWGGGGHYWSNNSYTNRRSYGNSDRYSSGTSRRTYTSGDASRRPSAGGTSTSRRTNASSSSRVVGTRTSASSRPGVSTDRGEASSSRRSTYTRPSSTRSTYNSSSRTEVSRPSSSSSSRPSSSSSSRPSSTYNRGSSTQPSSRSSYSSGSSRSSSTPSSSRSYSPSSSSSSRSSAGSYSGGSSSRSSGGGGGSSRSSSSRR